MFGDPATILPIDAVAELRVLSNYEAEYGRNSGAIVNIVTKSGTNSWHGSGLEYFRSGQTGARNFFNIASTPKNPFHNNQFGGSLGGPVIKDKTFVYLNYEGQRETGAQAATSCVPDPAVIAGLGGPFQPGDRANLLARKSLAVPQHPRRGQRRVGLPNGNNLSTATRFSNRVDSMIAKIDHNFNPNNLLTGRYYFGDSDQSFPFAQLGRRPSSRFQHGDAHAGPASFALLRAGGECQPGQRGARGLEPLRRGLLSGRPAASIRRPSA